MSGRGDYVKPQPAVISFGPLNFLITDRPNDINIHDYIQFLKSHQVQAVVRVCEPTYDTQPLVTAKIPVYDWEFEDGSFPPGEIVDKWMNLIRTNAKDSPGSTIAVHCVAGLGRAPVLVAVALMEAGMKWEDAVDLIRRERRGAINQKQLLQLQKFKPGGVLKGVKNGKKDNCSLM